MVTKGRNRTFRAIAVAVAVGAALAVTAACTPTKGGPGGERVLLVGDSIAVGFAPSLGGALGGRPFESAALAGCGIVRGITADWDGSQHPYGTSCDGVVWSRHEDYLTTFRPTVVVWLGIVELLPRYVDDGLYTPGLPGPGVSGAVADAKILELMHESWGHLQSRGARLVVLTMPPPTTSSPASIDQRTVHLNNLLKQFAASHPNTTLIDLAAIVCPTASQIPPNCPEQVGGVTLRKPDYHTHFTPEGAAWAAAQVASLIVG